MGKPHAVGRIEVDEDLGFLRREWRWQRISWVGFGLIVLAALTGAFGRGPVSKTQIGDRDRFAVEYQRMLRHGAEDEFVIYVGPAPQTDSLIQIVLPQQYVSDLKLEFSTPQPDQQIVRGDDVIMEFKRAEPGRALQIVAHLRPSGYGRVRGRIALAGAPALSFNHFVLP